MKNTYLILLLLIAFSGFSQQKENNSYIYTNTLKYLEQGELKDYKKIFVSDSIVFIDITSFFDVLKDNIAKNNLVLLDSLNEIDVKRRFNTYKLGNNKRCVHKRGKNMLFFSQPYKNILIAEFFVSKVKINNKYSNLTTFGESERFLFYLDNNNNVIKHLKIQMTYN